VVPLFLETPIYILYIHRFVGLYIEVACILPHFASSPGDASVQKSLPRCKGEEREESKKGQLDTYLGGGFKHLFVKSLFD